jgi:hypothetical protein
MEAGQDPLPRPQAGVQGRVTIGLWIDNRPNGDAFRSATPAAPWATTAFRSQALAAHATVGPWTGLALPHSDQRVHGRPGTARVHSFVFCSRSPAAMSPEAYG